MDTHNELLNRARDSITQRRRELLADAGGALSTVALADALGVSRQTIDKRRRAGALLAVRGPTGGWAFPRVQFGLDNQPLPGLRKVLNAFQIQDPWMKLAELLAPDEDLDGRSIFKILIEEGRSALPAAVRAVMRVGEHAA